MSVETHKGIVQGFFAEVFNQQRSSSNRPSPIARAESVQLGSHASFTAF